MSMSMFMFVFICQSYIIYNYVWTMCIKIVTSLTKFSTMQIWNKPAMTRFSNKAIFKFAVCMIQV